MYVCGRVGGWLCGRRGRWCVSVSVSWCDAGRNNNNRLSVGRPERCRRRDSIVWGLSNVPASLHSNHSNQEKKDVHKGSLFLVSTRTDVPESKSVIKLGGQGYSICSRVCVRIVLSSMGEYQALVAAVVESDGSGCQRHHGRVLGIGPRVRASVSGRSPCRPRAAGQPRAKGWGSLPARAAYCVASVGT